MSRVPRTDSASTSAPAASRAGWASPAGEAVPRLPPTPPRLRIWGEATVCEASASPGSSARRCSMMWLYGTEAPSRTFSWPTSHSVSSPMRFRSMRYSGRRWSKLISTITSVPPAIGTAVGCSAFAASASSQLAGRRKSMTGSLPRLIGCAWLGASRTGAYGLSHLRVREARLVHVLFTWNGLSTPSCTPPGSVAETMKELAGQGGHLVDSYERRCSIASLFSSGIGRHSRVTWNTSRQRTAATRMRLRALLDTDALGLKLLGGEDELDR